MLVLEIGIDVPGVPAFGFVAEGLQEVPAREGPGTAAVGFGGSERFRLISQIEKAGDASGLRIDGDADEPVLETIAGGFDRTRQTTSVNSHRVGGLRYRLHEICFVAQRRGIRKD